MQVEIFVNVDMDDLQTDINKWLQDNKPDIKDKNIVYVDGIMVVFIWYTFFLQRGSF